MIKVALSYEFAPAISHRLARLFSTGHDDGVQGRPFIHEALLTRCKRVCEWLDVKAVLLVAPLQNPLLIYHLKIP